MNPLINWIEHDLLSPYRLDQTDIISRYNDFHNGIAYTLAQRGSAVLGHVHVRPMFEVLHPTGGCCAPSIWRSSDCPACNNLAYTADCPQHGDPSHHVLEAWNIT
ncbi:hypothetical protein ACMA1D_10775 [Streptomyces sp. 796.1]|uniref:hypothetical protein n=1 Tax=Streptomyces sp. 796.1 TaxID=3163029 RepID=UPI0039C9C45A